MAKYDLATAIRKAYEQLSATQTAVSASKLQSPRQISLQGDATGSANFDGSQDTTITVQVQDNSHAHTIDNVAGLSSQLAEAQSKISALESGRAFGHAYGLVAKVFAAEAQEWIKFQTTDLIKRKISIPDNESFVVSSISSNVFRASAEIQLDDKNWRQMPQIFAVVIRAGTIISEKRILLAYTPNNGLTNQANAYQTISGSGYFYSLQVGDIIKFRLTASNGASVSLYSSGSLTVEEI